MVKVIYNSCFGGFGLSEAALRLGREKSGDPEWAKNDYELSRHDPILVQVVEELDEDANAPLADLKIAEVGGPYRIDEYDGNERVETPDSYEWINPQ